MFPEIYFISALDYCKDMIVSLISKITRAFDQACISGEGPEILKWERGGLCRRTWLADKENFRFQMVWEGQNNVRNYNFWGEIFLLVFLNVLQFYIQWKFADEILSIFQNLQTLSSGKGKNTHTAANERKNWEKPFKMIIINHFFFSRFVHNIFSYFASSFTAWFSLFDIRMT